MGTVVVAEQERAAVTCEPREIPEFEVVGETRREDFAGLFSAVYVPGEYANMSRMFVGSVELGRLVDVDILFRAK